MQPTPEAISAYEQQVRDWQSQYGEEMTCPVTGLIVPKTLEANVQWRRRLRAGARDSEAQRKALRQACSSSFIYWINAFGWTFHQKWPDEEGVEVAVTGDACHVPFITWKIQDDAALQLISCIERGEDALIDKSRDMGASWLVAAVFQWMWQFRPNTTFLEVSRKEMYVDQRGNMDSLFEKHRYMLRMQPLWLRPKRVRDNTMILENQDIGSSLIGESTNDDVGQGGRKTAILLDEFARVRNGEEIDLATADTSACRIFSSTVNGPATWYTKIYREMKAGRRAGKIIELPWEAHPAKGSGLTIIDVPVSPKNPTGRKAVSPWYIRQQAERSSRDLAQNIDRDHGKSGDSFFDPQEVEAHRTNFQGDPLYTGNLRFDEELNEDEKRSVLITNAVESVRFIEDGYRRTWKVWAPLVNGRPVQTHGYVFGVDISMGTGSSNSVISVFDNDANQKVAEFADAFTPPEELAWMVAMAGVWFGGGSGRPLLVWETNGPGSIFGKKIMQIGYSPVYFAKVEGTRSNRQTDRFGWNSTASRKEILLGMYRDALKNGRYINPCKESLDEAIDYVYNDRGLLIPASRVSEAGGASATHGDRVVADALCELGRKELPEVKPAAPVAPRNSFAGRREEFRRRLVSDEAAWLR
jgi:hypothetical protein